MHSEVRYNEGGLGIWLVVVQGKSNSPALTFSSFWVMVIGVGDVLANEGDSLNGEKRLFMAEIRYKPELT